MELWSIRSSLYFRCSLLTLILQYAQNTAAQLKTTQELVEAREQLDYVTDGYDNLVEKIR